MNNKEQVKNIIKNMTKTHLQIDVLNYLKDKGYNVNKSFVNRNSCPIEERRIELICKGCGFKFTTSGNRKYCSECRKHYTNDPSKYASQKDIEHRRNRKQYIEDAIEKTGLTKRMFKKLNIQNGVHEIIKYVQEHGKENIDPNLIIPYGYYDYDKKKFD